MKKKIFLLTSDERRETWDIQSSDIIAIENILKSIESKITNEEIDEKENRITLHISDIKAIEILLNSMETKITRNEKNDEETKENEPIKELLEFIKNKISNIEKEANENARQNNLIENIKQHIIQFINTNKVYKERKENKTSDMSAILEILESMKTKITYSEKDRKENRISLHISDIKAIEILLNSMETKITKNEKSDKEIKENEPIKELLEFIKNKIFNIEKEANENARQNNVIKNIEHIIQFINTNKVYKDRKEKKTSDISAILDILESMKTKITYSEKEDKDNTMNLQTYDITALEIILKNMKTKEFSNKNSVQASDIIDIEDLIKNMKSEIFDTDGKEKEYKEGPQSTLINLIGNILKSMKTKITYLLKKNSILNHIQMIRLSPTDSNIEKINYLLNALSLKSTKHVFICKEINRSDNSNYENALELVIKQLQFAVTFFDALIIVENSHSKLIGNLMKNCTNSLSILEESEEIPEKYDKLLFIENDKMKNRFYKNLQQYFLQKIECNYINFVKIEIRWHKKQKINQNEKMEGDKDIKVKKSKEIKSKFDEEMFNLKICLNKTDDFSRKFFDDIGIDKNGELKNEVLAMAILNKIHVSRNNETKKNQREKDDNTIGVIYTGKDLFFDAIKNNDPTLVEMLINQFSRADGKETNYKNDRIQKYFPISELIKLHECNSKTSKGPDKKKIKLTSYYFKHFDGLLGDEDKYIENIMVDKDYSDELINPFNELFMMSLIYGNKDLSFIFWKNTTFQLAASLAAFFLLKNLVKKAKFNCENQLLDEYIKMRNYFKEKSINLLTAINSSERKTDVYDILRKKIHIWGDRTIFYLASRSTIIKFLENEVCEDKISFIWYNNAHLQHLNPCLTVLCVICPFIVPFVSQYRNLKSIKKEKLEINIKSKENEAPIDNGIDKNPSNLTERIKKSADKYIKTIKKFFISPFSRFFYKAISYVIFLLIFSHCILSDMTKSNIPSTEIITGVYFLSFFIDTIRQISLSQEHSARNKIVFHLKSFWNLIDLLIYILCIVSISLRISYFKTMFIYPKTSYVFLLILTYIRFFHFFHIGKTIGPKIILIQILLKDLLFFILPFFVFLFSFAIGARSLMNSNTPISISFIKDIFTIPFFSIFGITSLDYYNDYWFDCSQSKFFDEVTKSQWNSKEDCRMASSIITCLYAIFLFVVNIVLINMLIALFGDTTTRERENSKSIWALHNYLMVEEAYYLTMLPPPFSLVENLLEFVLYLIGIKKKKVPTATLR